MNDSLEDALDGLQCAERYCFNNGLEDVGNEIATCYQKVGARAPTTDWDEE